VAEELVGWSHAEVVANGSMSGWRLVSLRGPYWVGPVLFNIFISDIAGLSALSASLQMTPS